MLPVSQVVDDLMQTRLDFASVTIADRLDEEVAYSLLTEELAQIRGMLQHLRAYSRRYTPSARGTAAFRQT